MLRKVQGICWALLLGMVSLSFSGCGQNPPANSTSLNFPFGIALYSDSTTSANSFMTITNYGTHQVLLFPDYSSASTGFFQAKGSANQTSALLSGLQGPDGLLVYPAASNISTLYGYTPQPIPVCGAITSPALLVADGIQNAIYIYCAFNPSNPNQNPTATIQGKNTQLVSPEGMSIATVDSFGNPKTPILFVANSGGGGVLAFDLSQITAQGTYDLTPSGGILPGVASGICSGVPTNNTSLNCPAGIYFSNQLKTLFLSNTGNNEVMIYANGYCLGVAYETPLPSGCSGNTNVQPSARLSGINTYISVPNGIGVYNNSLFVADSGAGDILIWDNVDKLIQGVPSGQQSPSRKIGGNLANLGGPYGLTYDPNETVANTSGGTGTLFLSQIGSGQIDGFSPASTFSGNNVPTYQVNIPVLNGSPSNGSSSGGLGFFP
ncbi:MAG: NHL repeat-containing protein [Leptospirales bacterium]